MVPERYEISLTPDLRAFTFAGEENVAVRVITATTEVVLNALELEIDRVSAERGGVTVAGKAALEPAHERARLSFDRALEPGEWTLRIAFRGILNDKLHGFYRSTYKDAQGNTHLVASTQFEATDARRAIPCWDEPALKASFKVRLVIDEGLSAFSNAGVESERSLGGGKKEIVYKETIKMSTYLLAFIVGEFEATEPIDAGTPLRVAHVPGKRALTAWAREIGAFSLKWFANYYELPYPGDKLDLIAIPDFASGAMENLGAITFRETALLIDEKSASRAELERVADVVAHENAHMWFGDLVTMKWWNGIWLNEAFATFMEMLAVDAWKPNWKRWESFSVSRTAAMAIDALSSTRPIEFTVLSPEDARAMFDVLTYEKGASVLRMLEQYLGAERFRKGIAAYLRKHQYANAETGDLWDALERASDEPVRKLMDSWIFQPGFPIVEAALGADGRALMVRQRRFFYLGENATAAGHDQLWQVPVMVRAKTENGVATHRLLLDGREATLDLGGRVEWALLNEGGHGFFRVRYAPDLLAALGRNLGELKAVERYALVSDSWAATVAGMMPLKEFLAMAARDARRDRPQRVARDAFAARLSRHDRQRRRASRAGRGGARDRQRRGGAPGMGPASGRGRTDAPVARHAMGLAGHARRRRRGAAARGRDLRALSQGSGLGGPRSGAGGDRNPGLRGRSARATKSSSNTLSLREPRRRSSATCFRWPASAVSSFCARRWR